MSFPKKISPIKLLLIFLSLGFYFSCSAVQAVEDVKTVRRLVIDRSKDINKLNKIGEFLNLEELRILCLNELNRIPDDIGKLRNLKILDMDQGNGCVMNPQLPESIGNLSELKELNLFGAQDISGGRSVGSSESPASKVRRILPRSLSNLTKLEKLNLGRNRYNSIPKVVFLMKSVRELNFTFNDLDDLPNDLLNLPYLSKIILGGNYKITCSALKRAELTKRFRGVYLDFRNQYPCQSPLTSSLNQICTRTRGSSVILRTGSGTNYSRGLVKVGSGGSAVNDYFRQRNYTITDGEQVSIFSSIRGADGLTWYQVGTNQWVAWVNADFVCQHP